MLLNSCRKMILSIHPEGQVNGWMTTILIGGTPLESPDINPIETAWHELKEYIMLVVKPKVKVQLEVWSFGKLQVFTTAESTLGI